MGFKLNTVLKIYLVLSCFSNAAQITFIVDMSEETIVAGDGNYPAVYVSGVNINGPGGLEMTNNGDGTWQLTTQLGPGNYTYKFRNGYYDYWDGPGWEDDNGLIDGNCAYGQYHDRQVIVQNNNITVGPFCFNSCDESCDEETINYTLVWYDDFDNSEIDLNKWNFEFGTGNWGWGNNEAQYYTNRPENAYIDNGILVIQALHENYGGMSYTSARLTTKNKGDWMQGKLEIRASLPTGIGTWPAIWMLPTDWVYGGWPESGEIDIMEHVGYNPNWIHGTIHTNEYNHMDGTQLGGQIHIDDASSNFHNYSIEWTDEYIKWYVDDVQFYSFYNDNQDDFATWPFNQNFHLIINLAIGGTWGGQQGIDNSTFPAQFKIDYVKVYEASQLSSHDRMLPTRYQFYQNFPNPFNPVTTFRYDLPEDGLVNITIYDLLGNEVNNLVKSNQSSGYKTINWDATDNQGRQISAGVYLYSIEAGNFRQTKKMIFLK